MILDTFQSEGLATSRFGSHAADMYAQIRRRQTAQSGRLIGVPDAAFAARIADLTGTRLPAKSDSPVFLKFLFLDVGFFVFDFGN